MSKKAFAVLGDPIGHSLSPKIHQAAYRHLALDYSYEAIRVASGHLESFVQENAKDFDGLSITMPLKFEASTIAEEYSDLVGTGVANTLVRTETGWTGYNTDVAGITFALAKCLQISPSTVAVLGAGATARSALVALSNAGISDVTLYARDRAKANSLDILAKTLELKLVIRELSSIGNQQELTINTLPAGVADTLAIAGSLRGWLLSANYSGTDQRFTALFSPAHVISGVEMLLGQALEQIRLFSSQDIEFTSVDSAELLLAMRAAL